MGVVKVFCGGKGTNLILHQRQKGQKYEEKVNVAKSGDNISARASPQTAASATVKACCGNYPSQEKPSQGKAYSLTSGHQGVMKNTKKSFNQIPGPALECLHPLQGSL